ncbi:signal peptidase II [Oricola cellulosilytica]|uniref:Lipoprotein signal peptidase n=1 Tax=Oricola cellulosilytica TaxID=1429082 RepID=A0A4R0PER4_9HYPH|nr:signal peptidase II [Oricola cellulosilytica]TCD16306.1 signal peptidase II [Oricola cellulosilytica]
MRRSLVAAGLAAAVVAIDQAIKRIVETQMGYHQSIELLPFFALFRTHNEGIAFSMLEGLGPLPLIVISLVVVAFVLWLWRGSDARRNLSHAGFILIIGGAVGNLIDRIALGYVVDYFLFHTPRWSFAVFNFADAAITVGAGLVMLDEFLNWRRQGAVEKSD